MENTKMIYIVDHLWKTIQILNKIKYINQCPASLDKISYKTFYSENKSIPLRLENYHVLKNVQD